MVAAEGGVPALPNSRVYGHAQLAVRGLRDVGLDAAPGKVVVGDPIVGLGFRVSRVDHEIRCPDVKRASMLADIDQQRELADHHLRVDRQRAVKLVGRACNLSQVFPEVVLSMHGGYAVTESSWTIRGRRQRPPDVHLARDSDACRGWLEFLDVTRDALLSNTGCDLAPRPTFHHQSEPGVYTATTDASGVDGVGGYVFCPDQPGVVWLVSEKWPDDLRHALARSAQQDDGTLDHTLPSLSMPAAELFGSIAVTAAVTGARRDHPTHLESTWRDGQWTTSTSPIPDPVDVSAAIAIGDCDPAVDATNAGTSGNSQMRCLLRRLKRIAPQWLAVSVPRTANSDADRLSHPDELDAVARDATAAGLSVRRVRLDADDWDLARTAAAIGVKPRKRSRPAPTT